MESWLAEGGSEKRMRRAFGEAGVSKPHGGNHSRIAAASERAMQQEQMPASQDPRSQN
jgi:hypothetical protein